MGFSFEQFHNAIDEIFEGRKGSEKIIFFSMPLLIFGFLSYKFITPISEKKIADKKTALESVRTEIADTKDFLKRKNEIIQETASIKELNKAITIKLQKQIAQNQQLANSMQNIDFINLNEKNIIDFIEYLTANASKNGVTIAKLETSLSKKENGVFKQELAVNMECSGAFRGVLGFINSIESSKMFSKIANLTVTHGDKLGAKINITVSGL